MRFEWDEDKNNSNIQKHGLDFVDVKEVFDGPMAISLDDRQDYGEDRWIGVGTMRNVVVVVAFTERGEDCIRLFSARKATKQERESYGKFLQDRLE